jgi:hypothetical protein
MCKRLTVPILLLLVLGLAPVQAQDVQWIRAAYADSRYPSAWAGNGNATRDALQAAGYEILDADQLKTWMQARITDKKLSVVVFTQDAVPDTVAESMSSSCTLRKYLDAGGKIVWYADIPFYYCGHADGTMTTWGDSGAPAVLGFNTSSAPRDTYQIPHFTPAGIEWGLTQLWQSQRACLPTATTNLTLLAVDNSGNAGGWVKHYVPNDTFRGFVRFRDVGGQADVGDIMRLAEYAALQAWNPNPADGATGVTMPLLMWTPGPLGVMHNVYLGTTPELTEADLIGSQLYSPMQFYTPGLIPGVLYFWRVDEIEADGTVRTGRVWSFTAVSTSASQPDPRDGDKWIDPSTILSWTAGTGAMSHDVYFSTDRAAVANRDAGALQESGHLGTTFDPGTLAAETTYWWAVDERDGATYPGAVWQFTTAPSVITGGARGDYFNSMTPSGVPSLTRIDTTIDFSWGEESPGAPLGVDQFSVRWLADLEIAAADTYTFITSSDDGVRLWLNEEPIIDQWRDQGTSDAYSQPLKLAAGIYSLRMEYYENGGGAVARLFWQTPTIAREIIPAGPLQPPVRARVVYPANGAVDIPHDVTLQWTAGEKAAQHDVYFGDDAQAVADATTADAAIYQGRQALEDTSFVPGTLEWNKVHFWRVDEINTSEPDSPWKGSVWSFTTADFIVVDDFETYNDVEGTDTRIYETWIDGYSDGSSGSIVGNLDPPFAEQTIVHGGLQSMPMDYNNIVAPYFSEAYREFSPLQNWTVNGVDTLSLFFRGNAARLIEDPAGTYTITANGADVWGTSDNFRFAYKTLTGDGAISAKVVSVTNTSNWAKAGVMIRESLDPAASYAFMFPTPDGRRAFQNRPGTGAGAVSAHSATGVAALPFWVKVERKGNQFTAYYSTDGTTWTPQPDTENTGTDASPNPQTILMSNSVLVGLAVTSNNGQAGLCTAVFSDVVVTGGASFKVADVGSVSPGNDPDRLYLTVQDSLNKSVTIAHPDPGAVNVTAWTEWKIPLSDLAGVSLNKVKRLYFGVGDKDNPVPDGAGRIYIDDIRVTKP